ncbi:MAG: molybdopterin molybdotransferase MoeA, partial [Planctomycetota bacterium]
GRVSAEEVRAERDSPAADVSAMDGYAVRSGAVVSAIEQNGSVELPVAFEVITGQTPEALPPESCVRVFTGGVVPRHADVVIPRELVRECPDFIAISNATLETIASAKNIRRQGQNAKAGQSLLPEGSPLTPAAVATLAANGYAAVEVRRRVKVGIAVSGNEVASVSRDDLHDAAVRDANGPALRALLATAPWLEVVDVVPLPDELETTRRKLAQMADRCDVIVTTGGVSMGDHDVIPDALIKLGGEVVYHHLSMRPGKPNLGVMLPEGMCVVALPGNPVSALVGAVILAGPVLRRCAGLSSDVRPARVEIESGPVPSRPASFRQFVPATLTPRGTLTPLAHQGSGDVAAIGAADGCFEVPPGQQAFDESWRYWHPWRISP